MPDPNAGVDPPKMVDVGVGVDPKAEGVVIEPKGEEPNVEVVVAPNTEGFAPNGFDCAGAGVPKGLDVGCPNVDVAKGLD